MRYPLENTTLLEILIKIQNEKTYFEVVTANEMPVRIILVENGKFVKKIKPGGTDPLFEGDDGWRAITLPMNKSEMIEELQKTPLYWTKKKEENTRL